MQIKRSHCLLGLALVTTAAMAANPAFLRAPSAQLGSPKVIVKWTEVGLGLTEGVDYIASATAAARYQCVNRGSNCPSASNKEDVLLDVSVGGTFAVKRKEPPQSDIQYAELIRRLEGIDARLAALTPAKG